MEPRLSAPSKLLSVSAASSFFVTLSLSLPAAASHDGQVTRCPLFDRGRAAPTVEGSSLCRFRAFRLCPWDSLQGRMPAHSMTRRDRCWLLLSCLSPSSFGPRSNKVSKSGQEESVGSISLSRSQPVVKGRGGGASSSRHAAHTDYSLAPLLLALAKHRWKPGQSTAARGSPLPQTPTNGERGRQQDARGSRPARLALLFHKSNGARRSATLACRGQAGLNERARLVKQSPANERARLVKQSPAKRSATVDSLRVRDQAQV